MGECIKVADINQQFIQGTKVPIILCTKDNKVSALVEQYNTYKVNYAFVNRMLSYSDEIKKLEVINVLRQLLDKQEKPIVLSDYEALFDPLYETDVIKLFEEIGKSNRLIIQWSGDYEDGILTFSKPENEDYHRYKIQNYNIYCVV